MYSLILMIPILTSMCTGFDLPTAPPPRPKPQVGDDAERPRVYVGEVMEVNGESITIRGRDVCNRDGQDVIRSFKAGPHLAKGQPDPLESAGWAYRLSDVKKGDKVIAMLRPSGEDDFCVQVRITRRPGGLVPPAPFENAEVPHRYHNDMNAYQANEERGVPLPLRLDPEYQRWLSQKQDRDLEAFLKRQDHTAPPPRAVKPK